MRHVVLIKLNPYRAIFRVLSQYVWAAVYENGSEWLNLNDHKIKNKFKSESKIIRFHDYVICHSR